MAIACRIKLNRCRRLLLWLVNNGILEAEHREHQTAIYTVAKGNQMAMPAVLDDLGLTPRQMSVARILLRFGIISIREAAKFARVSKNTAQAAIQRLEQAKTVTAHKIKGRTSQYLFSKAVLKMFKGGAGQPVECLHKGRQEVGCRLPVALPTLRVSASLLLRRFQAKELCAFPLRRNRQHTLP